MKKYHLITFALLLSFSISFSLLPAQQSATGAESGSLWKNPFKVISYPSYEYAARLSISHGHCQRPLQGELSHVWISTTGTDAKGLRVDFDVSVASLVPSYDANESAAEVQAASGFDADKHPVIRFVTDNQFELAKDWIQLNGTMTIQGVSQKVRLRATPVYDSPGCRKRMVKVIVDGEVDLNRFGVAGGEEMDQHPMLINVVLKNDGC